MRNSRVVLIIIAVLIAVAGYVYGPDLFDNINTPHRIDLNNRLTENDKDNIKLKLKSKTNVNVELTADEISSFWEGLESDIIPLTKVKFNTSADGITEINCIIDANRLKIILNEKGAVMEKHGQLLSIIKADRDLPAKIKGKFAIRNNKVSIDIQQMEIDWIPIPGFLYRNKTGLIENRIEEIIKQRNYNITSMTFADDKVHYEGYIP